MAVSFENLVPGHSYDRKYLAEIWGYQSFHAISRGVVTPAGGNLIILFVTETKQDSLTQYNDYIEEGFLHWEGETKHSSDDRVVRAHSFGDQIHLFHRKIHHSPFTYFGQIQLDQHNQLKTEPSQFIFRLPLSHEIKKNRERWNEPENSFAIGELDTERNAIVRSRIGQGVYRDGLLRLWGGCAVTGYERPALLLASHVKPWKISSDRERLDPYNGLLLQPTLDRLFDKGFVTFDKKGNLVRADSISEDEMVCLGIKPKSRLLKTPESTMRYLRYHRDHEFERHASSPIN